MGFRPCRDLIVTPLQVLWFLSQGNPRGQKTTRLHWPEGSVSHVKLTYGYWTEGEMYPACFWSVWVILFVLPYGTTPLCPYFKSFFFFFRPRIVIKRRGEIIEFGGLIIIIRWGTKTSIPPFPIFYHMDSLGVPFFIAESNHCWWGLYWEYDLLQTGSVWSWDDSQMWGFKLAAKHMLWFSLNGILRLRRRKRPVRLLAI